ncbi:hypothetical protein [Rhodoferax sp.]|uniref:hypothetical protein n=1 Tax=Rhodoferax sp. TaxID=50421 RepID=UPI0025E8076F|nr:hypothetical protein [Rhodoferax sp.]MCM2295573.1 hypothetical protein [Rhodoferax sp.]
MRKKMVGVLVAVLAGVGVGAGLGYGPLLRYKSEGVLSMEMGTAEYKRFAELATDANTVRQFAAVSLPPDVDSRRVDQLVSEVTKGAWLKPVPKVSKADAKELPDILLQLEQEREKTQDRERKSTVYLGLKLTKTAADPEETAKGATWLGNYFKDVATREAVREQVSRWALENRQFSDRAVERKLKYQFDIEQAQTRATALKKLVASYPDAARRESQQVVDVRKDNEKFMSPMAQLVGAESEIIDVREKIQRLDREMAQQAFAKAMVADAEAALNEARSGSDSVVRLSALIDRFSKLVKTEAEREKLSSLAADVSQISARFLSQAQFVAKPSVPTRPERPGPLMVMVLAGLLAGLLSAVFLWREQLKKMLLQNNES